MTVGGYNAGSSGMHAGFGDRELGATWDALRSGCNVCVLGYAF